MITQADPADIRELSGPQVVGTSVNEYDSKLSEQISAATWEITVNKLIAHPTVKLARLLSIAPALATEWTVEVDNKASVSDSLRKKVTNYLRRNILPLRAHLLETGLLGMVDYGWQPYEIVLKPSEVDAIAVDIAKIKPLLQSITDILVEVGTGAFAGLQQDAAIGNKDKDTQLSATKSLVFNQGVIGTNWYGRADLTAAEMPYNLWTDSCNAMNRHNKKTAGVFWVIKYPEGHATIAGETVTNAEAAKRLLTALQANGSILIPRSYSAAMGNIVSNTQRQGNTNKVITSNDWEVSLLEASGNSADSMLASMSYADSLILRSLGWPERAAIEGEHGTKADSETHENIGLTYVQHRHNNLLRLLNKYLVDRLVALNFGPKYNNVFRVTASAISKTDIAYLRKIYDRIITNPDGLVAEAPNIDMAALRETIGLPPEAGETSFADNLQAIIDSGNTSGVRAKSRVSKDPQTGVSSLVAPADVAVS